MKTIRNIGIYLPQPETSDVAVQRGEILAEVTKARLTLLVPGRQVVGLELARFVYALTHRSTVVALETGSADDVRQAVISNEIDIVLKAARPHANSRRIVGGVAQDLLRHCPCPLWIVRQAKRENRAPVIAAVSSLEPDSISRSKRVIETAAYMATIEGRELVVAHAWFPLECVRGLLDRAGRRVYLREQRRWMQERLASVVESSTPMPATLELLEGEPSIELPELALRLSSETIVVGHRGRRGLGALLFRNTGERLIDGTGASVISVRAK